MTASTLDRILKERGAKKDGAGTKVAEGEVATLLVGGDPVHPLPGIVRFVLAEDCVEVETRKGAHTYIEYESVRGVTFEPKELADRRTGF